MTGTRRTRPLWRNVTLVPQGRDLLATPSEPGVRRPPQPSLLPNRPGPYQDASAWRYTFKRPNRRVAPVDVRTRARALVAVRTRPRRTKRLRASVRSRSMVTQRPCREICSFTLPGALRRPLTVERLPAWMFNFFAVTLTSAAFALAGEIAVAVRQSAPAPSAQRIMDRDIGSSCGTLAGQGCLQGVSGDPRAALWSGRL